MKTIAGAILLVFCASTAAAQSDFNGQHWAEWSKNQKIMYLNGFVDGRASGMWEVIKTLDKKLFDKGPEAFNDPRLRPLDSSVTTGQTLVALDDFYKDYKNLNIGVRSAVPIVLYQLSGKEITEEDLQNVRRREAERSTKQDDENP